MAFLNIGEKDAQGHQKRIEHRGKYLRASRTGGVALRASTQAAGFCITANTSHGLRVSSQVAKNTQVAMQNSRFVLRGRYGKGANHINLSKSGFSVSTNNDIGTINWLKPNYSSVKIGGVQLRGKKAANIQAVFVLVQLLTQLLMLAFMAANFVVRLTVVGLVQGYHLLCSLPQRHLDAKRSHLNKRLQHHAKTLDALFQPTANHWPPLQLYAALLLVLTGWGRGVTAHEAAAKLTELSGHQPNRWASLRQADSHLNATAECLEHVRQQHSKAAGPHAIIAMVARAMKAQLVDDELVKNLLDADEIALEEGPRNRLQEQLLQVFADFAGLRLNANPNIQNDSSGAETVDTPHHAHSHESTSGLNINHASFEELQTLPHIGPERAAEIIALRPIQQLKQLTTVDGIGPARLKDIQQAGAYVFP